VSSFLTAHQHIIGYYVPYIHTVPYNGVNTVTSLVFIHSSGGKSIKAYYVIAVTATNEFLSSYLLHNTGSERLLQTQYGKQTTM